MKTQKQIQKPFLHLGQEQFLDKDIEGDINFSKDGKEILIFIIQF